MGISTNQRGPSGYVTFVTTTTDGLKLNTANGKAGANVVNETVNELAVTNILWSVSGTNTWQINRGSNTIATLAGSGVWDLQGEGVRLEADAAQLTSNVDIALSGGSGTLVLKMHKKSGQ